MYPEYSYACMQNKCKFIFDLNFLNKLYLIIKKCTKMECAQVYMRVARGHAKHMIQNAQSMNIPQAKRCMHRSKIESN